MKEHFQAPLGKSDVFLGSHSRTKQRIRYLAWFYNKEGQGWFIVTCIDIVGRVGHAVKLVKRVIEGEKIIDGSTPTIFLLKLYNDS